MSGRHVDSARLRATDDLLGRIMSILDAARGQVVRAVNHATVSAYWHIGREVVEALQQDGERAAYGKALIERLAQQLTDRYGKGFSATNLGYFRQFYLAYRDRIPHPPGGELPPTFHPNLSWSHYRALMGVTDADARRFYEAEAVRANWSRRDLDRQINSLYHQRLLASCGCFGIANDLPHRNIKPIASTFQRGELKILLSVLKGAEVGTVHLDVVCEPLLSEVPRLPMLANHQADPILKGPA